MQDIRRFSETAWKSSTQGYFLKKDVNETLISRSCLLEFPTNCYLTLPEKSYTFETFEFSNSEHSEEFEKVIQNGGESLAITYLKKLKNLLLRRTEECDRLKGNVIENSRIKKWSKKIKRTYVSVPVASFSLANVDSIEISKQALEELKDLENKFNQQCTNSRDNYLNFFEKYGSHYFDGMFHIGGRRHECKTSESRVSKELISGQNSVDVSEDHSQSSFEKHGGGEADNISEWVKEMIQNPQLWVIYDREMTERNFHGIWELILDYPDYFVDAHKFSQSLKDAWESITGLNEAVVEEGITYVTDVVIAEQEQKLEEDIEFLEELEELQEDKMRDKLTYLLKEGTDITYDLKQSGVEFMAYKRGIIDDDDKENKNHLAQLLRYHTSHSGPEMISLETYISRKPVLLNGIYYINEQTQLHPHNDFETLILNNDIDMNVVIKLQQYKGLPFCDVCKMKMT